MTSSMFGWKWMEKRLNEADPRAMWFVTEQYHDGGYAYEHYEIKAHWVQFELGFVPVMYSAKTEYSIARSAAREEGYAQQFLMKILREFDYFHDLNKQKTMDELKIEINPFLYAKIKEREAQSTAEGGRE